MPYYSPKRCLLARQGVTSTLQVKNGSTQRDTFWIRYSVQDKAGTTYNVPATSVTLDPGAKLTVISRTWKVPNPADPSTLTTGFYEASFSVYDADPNTSPDAVLLDYDEKADASERTTSSISSTLSIPTGGPRATTVWALCAIRQPTSLVAAL